MTLISAENSIALMAGLFVIAGGSFLAERTRIGSHLTGAVIAILTAILAANLRIIPHAAPAYDFVFSYFVPILIPLFLFKANLRTMLFETTRMTGAFLIASTGTILGVLVAASLLDLGSLASGATTDPALREAGIAGLFTSTYIGGSVNYAALGEITGLRTDASFFSAATATDNLFSAVFLSVLALLPGWNWLARRFTTHQHGEEPAVAERTDTISATSLTLALATAISFVAIGDAITGWIGVPSARYAIITALVVGAATLFPQFMEKLHGGFELGVSLAFVFFAAIAAGADLVAMVQIAPLLVATTAPALAAARGWHDLVTPGVLVGVLGYALGTFAGTAIFHLWG